MLKVKSLRLNKTRELPRCYFGGYFRTVREKGFSRHSRRVIDTHTWPSSEIKLKPSGKRTLKRKRVGSQWNLTIDRARAIHILPYLRHFHFSIPKPMFDCVRIFSATFHYSHWMRSPAAIVLSGVERTTATG